jgi:signal peptidase I
MEGFNFVNKLLNQPKKGDIVVFNSGVTINENGEMADYIKRVVATEGDEIEIRDGFFYLNGQLTGEPYIYKARSTFGGNFLKECKKIKIPNDYVFVMGDNRKRSKDSREIGFVSINGIVNILPNNKQTEFKDNFRDISNDKDGQGLPSFNLEDYYSRLNKIRTDNSLKELKRNEKLEKAAVARAKSIIENNEMDFSKNDKPKYSYEKAIKDAGYYNITIGEIRTTGYFDSEELSDYWEGETKENILNKEFQDTGVGAYVGKIDGCEIQVIVQEFGGYVPPNYSKEVVDSWGNAVNNLNSVISSWEGTKGWDNINQDDLNKLLDLLYKEKTIASNISSKMETGKWLSNEENNSIDEYENLVKQSTSLANKLNGN